MEHFNELEVKIAQCSILFILQCFRRPALHAQCLSFTAANTGAVNVFFDQNDYYFFFKS